MFHRSVNAGKTGIDVRDGIVTLQGYAATYAQKDLSAEYTRDVERVKDVNNEMIVSKTSKSRVQVAGEKINDTSIAVRVRMALLLLCSTSALNTTLEAERGVVTLRGNAGNAAKKDLVTRLVIVINGVKSVKNQMTVR
ncbi:MAG: BON domain-containing protein [Spirochaetes bacterium]|nr:BON domain-containing protein [Spirochaetota bacterium]